MFSIAYYFVYTYTFFSCCLHDCEVASVQRRRLGAKTLPLCKDVASVQKRAHHGRGQVNWVKWYPLV